MYKMPKRGFLFGRLYLASGDSFSAEKELEQALELGYNANKTLPLLARAYMISESDEETLSLEKEAEFLNKSSEIQFLAYKTIAALRVGNEKLASETFALALSMSNSDGYSMLANAYLAFAKKNTAHAATLVGRILTVIPNNANALML